MVSTAERESLVSWSGSESGGMKESRTSAGRCDRDTVTIKHGILFMSKVSTKVVGGAGGMRGYVGSSRLRPAHHHYPLGRSV